MGPNAEHIKAANVLVGLWSTDQQTAAAREAACAAWLADKGVWLQAKQEYEYPSEVSLAGSPAGHDLDLIRALMALRRDSVRSDANGGFTFEKVPFGAYTVEAEAVANDKFVQWAKDVGVIPGMPAQVELGPNVLVENQYCALSEAPVDTAKIYETASLDRPLVIASHRAVDISETPSLRDATTPIRIAFVIGEDGIPDVKSVRVTQGNLSDDEARKLIEAMTYRPSTVQGKPAKVRTTLEIRVERRISPGD